MRLIRGAGWRGPAAAAAVVAALALGSCSEDEGGNGGGGDEGAVLEERLLNGIDNVPGFTDALNRLVLTVNGSPQPGVSITPIAGGYAGTVQVDLTEDGNFDTSASGTLIFNDESVGLAGGALLTVDDVEELDTGTGSANVSQTGFASVALTNGNFSGTRTTTNPELELNISDANLGLDTSTGQLVVSGTNDFFYNGLDGNMEFVPVPGGFEIDVSGDGFEPFTVP
jgi:hypothetical protein